MSSCSIVLEDTLVCARCHRPLVTISFTLHGHAAEERACGPCDTRALLIDGVVVTKEELLAGVPFG